MREVGRLTTWDDARGFGFIAPVQEGPRVFVHISEFPKGRRPVVEDLLHYSTATDERGRVRAVQVSFVESLPEPEVYFSWTPATWVMFATVLVFILALFAMVLIQKLPFFIPLAYSVLSLLLFREFRHDKQAAKKDRWRIPENRMHLLSVLGGWPGALVAQQGLRHKSKKYTFLIPFWLTILLNLTAFAIFALCLSEGMAFPGVRSYE
jgi:uncharacterized membrane protein YsdA (DUF1294 family)/cold shock CspA family protein